jgi:hypothetical protein
MGYFVELGFHMTMGGVIVGDYFWGAGGPIHNLDFVNAIHKMSKKKFEFL